MDESTIDILDVLISVFSQSLEEKQEAISDYDDDDLDLQGITPGGPEEKQAWVDIEDVDVKEDVKEEEKDITKYDVREAGPREKWIKKKKKGWIDTTKLKKRPKRKERKRSGDVKQEVKQEVPQEIKQYWMEDVKQEVKQEVKEESEITKYSIRDWLGNNGYPLFIAQIFEDQNINLLSDFTGMNDDTLDAILNSLEISDPITKSRLISDIMNYILKYKHGVFHLKYYNPNANVISGIQQEPVPEEKTMVTYNDDKLNTDLTYLGLYKVVILDYLYHKRIEGKPKIEMDKHRDEYLAEVSIYIPWKITGFSIGKEELSSEFYAYKNLYCKLIINANWIDRRTFNGLIRKYQIISLPFKGGNSYSYHRDNYKLFLYFYGFKQFRESNEIEKAKYFFNKNVEDSCGGREKWIQLYVDKQIIWFHGFYYLFCNEIEASKDIYHMIFEENKDLIWSWMKSYNTRKEFYANIITYGLLEALNVLKIH